ncbi:hypothetical protein BDN67DRAFT_983514 [Paxillus ammoniavirescens]|nr:hypothetical protein BDN67DRAFT_983514 [Paxillus ammoniavirescens]
MTADDNCQRVDSSSQVLNLTSVNTTLAVNSPGSGSTSTAYTLIAWNSTANCNTNLSSPPKSPTNIRFVRVTPLITTTRINGGIANPFKIILNKTFSPNKSDLLPSDTNYNARNSQGLLNKLTGDTLYSIYSGNFNNPMSNNTDKVYRELEDYCRGDGKLERPVNNAY